MAADDIGRMDSIRARAVGKIGLLELLCLNARGLVIASPVVEVLHIPPVSLQPCPSYLLHSLNTLLFPYLSAAMDEATKSMCGRAPNSHKLLDN